MTMSERHWLFLHPVTPIRPESPSGLNSVVAKDTTARTVQTIELLSVQIIAGGVA